MFDLLRQAFSNLVGAVRYRTLSDEEVKKFLDDFRLQLLQADVAYEVVDKLLDTIKPLFTGIQVARGSDPSQHIGSKIKGTILQAFEAAGTMDLQASAQAKQPPPYIILFLGVNGSGKTTSVAKFAQRFREWGFTVLLACADTFRAGAIEQLAEHAERLKVKMVAQRYGADPAAVARDAVEHAQAHGYRVVLIDTAGRLQTKRNLMEEMAKIIRVVKPDLKIFVGDALTGNDAVSQAREFFRYTGFDAAVLCKADADVKGGAALSIVYTTKRPLLYLGTGQTYGDLTPFEPNAFVDSLIPSS